jgi:hypothetical protein
MRNETHAFGRSRRNLAKALFERYPDTEIAAIDDLAPRQTITAREDPRLADFAPAVTKRDAAPRHV